jgi:N-acetylglucosaminyldiphosphoundecaprenol N-acetyl-beta-D-mannosaminyltransferase
MQNIHIASIKIDNLSFDDSLRAIEKQINQKENSFVVTPNVDHIVNLQKDHNFRRIYKEACLVLADGMPLIWASKFLNAPLIERVAGSDLFPELCRISAQKGYRIFLLGGRKGAAVMAKNVLTLRHPDINIVGTYCPDFGFEYEDVENQKIMRIIKKAQPDLLFVGLGSPKQEKWIYKHKDLYNVPVSIGIGVSFEFIAGMVKRAPVWMRNSGLEWFWRLLIEPQKLWKRYLVNDMQFFKLILKQKLRQK